MQCKRASGCGLTRAVAVVGDFHHASFVIVLTAACDEQKGKGGLTTSGLRVSFYLYVCVSVSVSCQAVHIPSHLSP